MERKEGSIDTAERAEALAEALAEAPADCTLSRRERKGYRVFRRLLAHVQLMLSVIVLTCFVIDKFNSSMEFMESSLTKALVGVLAVFTMITAIMTITAYWPKTKK